MAAKRKPPPTVFERAKAAVARFFSVSNVVFLTATVGSLWGGTELLLPLLRSDAPPVASVARVDEVGRRLAQLSNQDAAAQRDFRKSVEQLQGPLTRLLKQSVVGDLQYWQSQRELTLAKLKKDPGDEVARAYLKIVEKGIADSETQLRQAK